MIYLCSADGKTGRQCISAPPTSLFLSLILPRKGQPFPPERRNCSHTFRGVLQFRLPSAPQRYNTLDFPTENRVPTGMLLAPIGNPEPKELRPSGHPFMFVQRPSISSGAVGFFLPNMKPSHRFNSLSTWKSVCCFAVMMLLSEPHSHESDL